ncbi:MAG TPA: ribosome biogenesis GTP-binding protein YihA/YsxC [Limnochordia bacterium]|nr:ribosome biogenesis GTP-binding protein YihA/YsxC [Limnochordia bacterium]
MEFRKVRFETSAGRVQEFPGGDAREIAMLGRSNVGKSSLINALTGSKVALTSGKPGKTRRLNFYALDNGWRLVDLPGYGYARVSKEERAGWGELIEAYLRDRERLAGCLLLVDARHEPQASDLQMAEWLRAAGLPAIVVATKSDKLSRGALQKQLGSFARDFALPVVPFSAPKRSGVAELARAIDHLFVDGGA